MLNAGRTNYDRKDAAIAAIKQVLEGDERPPPCDNSCTFGPPGGQGTNGGCRCDEHALRMGAARYRKALKTALAFLLDC